MDLISGVIEATRNNKDAWVSMSNGRWIGIIFNVLSMSEDRRDWVSGVSIPIVLM
jgi:hypothetical protein